MCFEEERVLALNKYYLLSYVITLDTSYFGDSDYSALVGEILKEITQWCRQREDVASEPMERIFKSIYLINNKNFLKKSRYQ